MPNAYIFSGLPGVGKTTLAKQLAKAIPNTVYFRIDTIEYYLNKAYSQKPTKEGYEIAFYQAKENLKLGKNIIIDCCNPVTESRKLWNKLSEINSTKVINIEVICSDKQIHQNRVETRYKSDPNKYPTWQNVLDRDYQVWNQDIIKIDTANFNIEYSLKTLIDQLKEY
ncbi:MULTISPECIES: AAA family ATPase [unclassified Francisella]|uniref:AAA family ATPase n=1 Tax=unclassified Francisella TaxID=2610885 RepID=UPI002E32E504|nr:MULTISPECIES: AAA family ATPase [unclassified Francisella]MED7818470.1 AAA family ATPase [Francisella sp. 19S2-4]MED7829275.1 AAA family ATPase [Francisella sp. 19S2-10]